MLDFLTKGITKIFGSKSEKDIKEALPYVAKTKEVYATLQALTNDELRDKTNQVKNTIDGHLKSIDDQIAELQKNVDENPEMDINEKETTFNKIDSLEEERNVKLEEVLLEVLPDAFAIIKDERRLIATLRS